MGAYERPAKAALRLIFFILLMDVIGLSRLFPIAPFLARRYSDDALMVTMLTVNYAAAQFVAAPGFWLLAPTVALTHAAGGFAFPTLAALTANRVSPREQGLLMGVTTALGSLMSILGPLWAGPAYERIIPGAPYLIGAGVLVLAALAFMPAPSPRSVGRPT